MVRAEAPSFTLAREGRLFREAHVFTLQQNPSPGTVTRGGLPHLTRKSANQREVRVTRARDPPANVRREFAYIVHPHEEATRWLKSCALHSQPRHHVP